MRGFLFHIFLLLITLLLLIKNLGKYYIFKLLYMGLLEWGSGGILVYVSGGKWITMGITTKSGDN